MSAPQFEVIHCTTPEDLERCIAIRMEVFVKEQGFTVEDEMDGKDALADHLLLLVDGTDAGTVRWLPHMSKLGRLAVLPQYRNGLGAGKRLVAALDEHVAHRRGKPAVEIEGRPGEVLLVANSQAHAVPFYVKQGYEIEGPEFDEDGQPHRRTVKVIKLVPQ